MSVKCDNDKAKEIAKKDFSVLDINFEIPPTEMGIYYRRDNSSAELRSLVKTIEELWKIITK